MMVYTKFNAWIAGVVLSLSSLSLQAAVQTYESQIGGFFRQRGFAFKSMNIKEGCA